MGGCTDAGIAGFLRGRAGPGLGQISALLLAVAILGSCASTGTISSRPTGALIPPGTLAPISTSHPATTAAGCSGLDATLVSVVAASDPVAEATRLGLHVTNESVEVVLALGAGDPASLDALGVTRGSRVGDSLTAVVPLGGLCQVAETDLVISIRVPSQAVPQ